jgi:hypothetical protein
LPQFKMPKMADLPRFNKPYFWAKVPSCSWLRPEMQSSVQCYEQLTLRCMARQRGVP